MQVATMEPEGDMVVKRLSVPIGLEELMESLTKEVLRQKPADIYAFASEHFSQLLEIRDQGNGKGCIKRINRSYSQQSENIAESTNININPLKIKSATFGAMTKIPRTTARNKSPAPKSFLSKKNIKVDDKIIRRTPINTNNKSNSRQERTKLMMEKRRTNKKKLEDTKKESISVGQPLELESKKIVEIPRKMDSSKRRSEQRRPSLVQRRNEEGKATNRMPSRNTSRNKQDDISKTVSEKVKGKSDISKDNKLGTARSILKDADQSKTSKIPSVSDKINPRANLNKRRPSKDIGNETVDNIKPLLANAEISDSVVTEMGNQKITAETIQEGNKTASEFDKSMFNPDKDDEKRQDVEELKNSNVESTVEIQPFSNGEITDAIITQMGNDNENSEIDETTATHEINFKDEILKSNQGDVDSESLNVESELTDKIKSDEINVLQKEEDNENITDFEVKSKSGEITEADNTLEVESSMKSDRTDDTEHDEMNQDNTESNSILERSMVDSVKSIVKIQAVIRGYLTRKLNAKNETAVHSKSVSKVPENDGESAALKAKLFNEEESSMSERATKLDENFAGESNIGMDSKDRELTLADPSELKQKPKMQKQFSDEINSVVIIQALIRGYLARKAIYKKKLDTANIGTTIEVPDDSNKDVTKYIDMHKAATVIQALIRGHLVRKTVKAFQHREANGKEVNIENVNIPQKVVVPELTNEMDANDSVKSKLLIEKANKEETANFLGLEHIHYDSNRYDDGFKEEPNDETKQDQDLENINQHKSKKFDSNGAFGDNVKLRSNSIEKLADMPNIANAAATKIQSAWRDHRTKRSVKSVALEDLQKPPECDELLYQRTSPDDAMRAAIVIQALFRGYLTRKRYEKADQYSLKKRTFEGTLPPLLEVEGEDNKYSTSSSDRDRTDESLSVLSNTEDQHSSIRSSTLDDKPDAVNLERSKTISDEEVFELLKQLDDAPIPEEEPRRRSRTYRRSLTFDDPAIEQGSINPLTKSMTFVIGDEFQRFDTTDSVDQSLKSIGTDEDLTSMESTATNKVLEETHEITTAIKEDVQKLKETLESGIEIDKVEEDRNEDNGNIAEITKAISDDVQQLKETLSQDIDFKSSITNDFRDKPGDSVETNEFSTRPVSKDSITSTDSVDTVIFNDVYNRYNQNELRQGTAAKISDDESEARMLLKQLDGSQKQIDDRQHMNAIKEQGDILVSDILDTAKSTLERERLETEHFEREQVDNQFTCNKRQSTTSDELRQLWQDEAATTIQKNYRGYRIRHDLEKKRQEIVNVDKAKEERADKEITRYLKQITEPIRRAFSADKSVGSAEARDREFKKRAHSANVEAPNSVYIPLRDYSDEEKEALNEIPEIRSLSSENADEANNNEPIVKNEEISESTTAITKNTQKVDNTIGGTTMKEPEIEQTNLNTAAEVNDKISACISAIVEPVTKRFQPDESLDNTDIIEAVTEETEPVYQYIPLRNYSEEKDNENKSIPIFDDNVTSMSMLKNEIGENRNIDDNQEDDERQNTDETFQNIYDQIVSDNVQEGSIDEIFQKISGEAVDEGIKSAETFEHGNNIDRSDETQAAQSTAEYGSKQITEYINSIIEPVKQTFSPYKKESFPIQQPVQSVLKEDEPVYKYIPLRDYSADKSIQEKHSQEGEEMPEILVRDKRSFGEETDSVSTTVAGKEHEEPVMGQKEIELINNEIKLGGSDLDENKEINDLNNTSKEELELHPALVDKPGSHGVKNETSLINDVAGDDVMDKHTEKDDLKNPELSTVAMQSAELKQHDADQNMPEESIRYVDNSVTGAVQNPHQVSQLHETVQEVKELNNQTGSIFLDVKKPIREDEVPGTSNDFVSEPDYEGEDDSGGKEQKLQIIKQTKADFNGDDESLNNSIANIQNKITESKDGNDKQIVCNVLRSLEDTNAVSMETENIIVDITESLKGSSAENTNIEIIDDNLINANEIIDATNDVKGISESDLINKEDANMEDLKDNILPSSAKSRGTEETIVVRNTEENVESQTNSRKIDDINDFDENEDVVDTSEQISDLPTENDFRKSDEMDIEIDDSIDSRRDKENHSHTETPEFVEKIQKLSPSETADDKTLEDKVEDSNGTFQNSVGDEELKTDFSDAASSSDPSLQGLNIIRIEIKDKNQNENFTYIEENNNVINKNKSSIKSIDDILDSLSSIASDGTSETVITGSDKDTKDEEVNIVMKDSSDTSKNSIANESSQKEKLLGNLQVDTENETKVLPTSAPKLDTNNKRNEETEIVKHFKDDSEKIKLINSIEEHGAIAIESESKLNDKSEQNLYDNRNDQKDSPIFLSTIQEASIELDPNQSLVAPKEVQSEKEIDSTGDEEYQTKIDNIESEIEDVLEKISSATSKESDTENDIPIQGDKNSKTSEDKIYEAGIEINVNHEYPIEITGNEDHHPDKDVDKTSGGRVTVDRDVDILENILKDEGDGLRLSGDLQRDEIIIVSPQREQLRNDLNKTDSSNSNKDHIKDTPTPHVLDLEKGDYLSKEIVNVEEGTSDSTEKLTVNMNGGDNLKVTPDVLHTGTNEASHNKDKSEEVEQGIVNKAYNIDESKKEQIGSQKVEFDNVTANKYDGTTSLSDNVTDEGHTTDDTNKEKAVIEKYDNNISFSESIEPKEVANEFHPTTSIAVSNDFSIQQPKSELIIADQDKDEDSLSDKVQQEEVPQSTNTEDTSTESKEKEKDKQDESCRNLSQQSHIDEFHSHEPESMSTGGSICNERRGREDVERNESNKDDISGKSHIKDSELIEPQSKSINIEGLSDESRDIGADEREEIKRNESNKDDIFLKSEIEEPQVQESQIMKIGDVLSENQSIEVKETEEIKRNESHKDDISRKSHIKDSELIESQSKSINIEGLSDESGDIGADEREDIKKNDSNKGNIFRMSEIEEPQLKESQIMKIGDVPSENPSIEVKEREEIKQNESDNDDISGNPHIEDSQLQEPQSTSLKIEDISNESQDSRVGEREEIKIIESDKDDIFLKSEIEEPQLQESQIMKIGDLSSENQSIEVKEGEEIKQKESDKDDISGFSRIEDSQLQAPQSTSLRMEGFSDETQDKAAAKTSEIKIIESDKIDILRKSEVVEPPQLQESPTMTTGDVSSENQSIEAEEREEIKGNESDKDNISGKSHIEGSQLQEPKSTSLKIEGFSDQSQDNGAVETQEVKRIESDKNDIIRKSEVVEPPQSQESQKITAGDVSSENQSIEVEEREEIKGNESDNDDISGKSHKEESQLQEPKSTSLKIEGCSDQSQDNGAVGTQEVERIESDKNDILRKSEVVEPPQLQESTTMTTGDVSTENQSIEAEEREEIKGNQSDKDNISGKSHIEGSQLQEPKSTSLKIEGFSDQSQDNGAVETQEVKRIESDKNDIHLKAETEECQLQESHPMNQNIEVEEREEVKQGELIADNIFEEAQVEEPQLQESQYALNKILRISDECQDIRVGEKIKRIESDKDDILDKVATGESQLQESQSKEIGDISSKDQNIEVAGKEVKQDESRIEEPQLQNSQSTSMNIEGFSDESPDTEAGETQVIKRIESEKNDILWKAETGEPQLQESQPMKVADISIENQCIEIEKNETDKDTFGESRIEESQLQEPQSTSIKIEVISNESKNIEAVEREENKRYESDENNISQKPHAEKSQSPESQPMKIGDISSENQNVEVAEREEVKQNVLDTDNISQKSHIEEPQLQDLKSTSINIQDFSDENHDSGAGEMQEIKQIESDNNDVLRKAATEERQLQESQSMKVGNVSSENAENADVEEMEAVKQNELDTDNISEKSHIEEPQLQKSLSMKTEDMSNESQNINVEDEDKTKQNELVNNDNSHKPSTYIEGISDEAQVVGVGAMDEIKRYESDKDNIFRKSEIGEQQLQGSVSVKMGDTDERQDTAAEERKENNQIELNKDNISDKSNSEEPQLEESHSKKMGDISNESQNIKVEEKDGIEHSGSDKNEKPELEQPSLQEPQLVRIGDISDKSQNIEHEEREVGKEKTHDRDKNYREPDCEEIHTQVLQSIKNEDISDDRANIKGDEKKIVNQDISQTHRIDKSELPINTLETAKLTESDKSIANSSENIEIEKVGDVKQGYTADDENIDNLAEKSGSGKSELDENIVVTLKEPIDQEKLLSKNEVCEKPVVGQADLIIVQEDKERLPESMPHQIVQEIDSTKSQDVSSSNGSQNTDIEKGEGKSYITNELDQINIKDKLHTETSVLDNDVSDLTRETESAKKTVIAECTMDEDTREHAISSDEGPSQPIQEIVEEPIQTMDDIKYKIDDNEAAHTQLQKPSFSDSTNQSNNDQIQSSNGGSEIGETSNNIETTSVDKIHSKKGESEEETKLQEKEGQGDYIADQANDEDICKTDVPNNTEHPSSFYLHQDTFFQNAPPTAQEKKFSEALKLTTDSDKQKDTLGMPRRLLHSSEYHDSIPISVSTDTPEKPLTTKTNGVQCNIERERSMPTSTVLVHSGELHDNILPLALQMNQDPGIEIVTSPNKHQTSVGSIPAAQAFAKDVSAQFRRLDTTRAQSKADDMVRSMDKEKRNNSTLHKKNMESEAATKIQASFRGYQVRKQLKNKLARDNIAGIKRTTRRKSLGRIAEARSANKQPTDLEEQSATKIQAGIRGFLVRRRQKKTKPNVESV